MIIDYKRIDLFGKLLFEKAVIKPPFKIDVPMPDEACFLHVRQGEYYSVSEEESLTVPEKQAVLMKCGNYLGKMVGNPKNGIYEAIAVHFFPEVLKKVYEDALPEFLKKHNYRFHQNMVKLESTKLIEKYIESLFFYFEHPQLVSNDILILKLKEIILLLLQTENSPKVIEILSNLFTQRTFEFKKIIEAHIFSDLDIKDLAQLTNLSLSSFKRKFKALYQDSPANYFKRIRLEKAAELLSISDESIGQIAFDCGFKEIAHFSSCFKEKYGFPPSLYRVNLKHKKLNQN